MLCFVGGFTTAEAQNNTRLSTRTAESSSHYLRQVANVPQTQVYTVRPNFTFTGLSVRISSHETFDGAYVVYQQDTFYLQADEHIRSDTAGLASNLIVFDRSVRAVQFYPATVRGDVSFSFFDARGEKKSLSKSLRAQLPQRRPSACEEPALVTPEVWRAGLPAPTYVRSATEVAHVIVHHSATYNRLTDYENVVRNIYLFHTQDRGWSDIGYNYLVAPDGTIFGGRSAGPSSVARDNIRGAHFCGQNSATMGVCLLGNYNTAVPTDTALTSLIKLTGWKIHQEGLNPRGERPHPTNTRLGTIAGHRDGCDTECPGDNLYARLDEVRAAVADYLAAGCEAAPVAVSVYPVPTTDRLTVVLPDNASPEAITVYDLAGKSWPVTVVSEDTDARTVQIDTHLLAAGLYVLHLRGAGWQQHRKVVVR